jgi:hypothetical protein
MRRNVSRTAKIHGRLRVFADVVRIKTAVSKMANRFYLKSLKMSCPRVIPLRVICAASTKIPAFLHVMVA